MYTGHMAQITVYVPDDVLAAARRHAKEQDRSLSAWVSGLIWQETTADWPKSLVDLLHHGSGDLVEPDDQPPEDVEPFR